MKMSKSKENEIQKGTNDVTENRSENSSELRRQQLMVEIRSLKILIATIESSKSVIKFGDVCKKDHVPTTSERKKKSNLVDIDLMIKNELYSLAGVSCKKVGNAFIFGFECWSIGRLKNGYWIKLYNDSDQWRLGHFVMPMSVDVNDILTKFSIGSPNDMIYFLRECKHQIECYNRRKQQYHELKEFISKNHYSCYVEADSTFMRITIKLLKATCSSSDESPVIRVDLYYKTDETRSSKMVIDYEDLKKLSDPELKKLKIYFKSFKELDLKDAAEKILSSDESPLIWRRESENEVFEIDEDLDDEVEASFMRILEKSVKSSKKNDKQSRIEPIDLSDIEDADEDSADNPKKRKKGRMSERKKLSTKQIDDQKNNKIPKSSKNDSNIVKKSPLRDRNDNVKNASSKLTMIRTLAKNNIALSKMTSSTPLTERKAPLSTISEDEISEIVMESTVKEKKSRKARQFDESDSSVECDEKNAGEEAELLKDLRAVKDNNNPTKNVGKKTIKKKSKGPARRQSKIAKKSS